MLVKQNEIDRYKFTIIFSYDELQTIESSTAHLHGLVEHAVQKILTHAIAEITKHEQYRKGG